MAKRSRRFELTAFGLAVALVVLVAFLGYRSSAAQIETARWVDHSHEVIRELNAVLMAAVDAETGRRGYAITNEESFLEPYRDAAARVATHTNEVRRLTSDNPEQQARLVALGPQLDARMRRLEAAIAAQRSGANGGKVDLSETVRGKADMDVVRASIGEMMDAEHRLLVEREKRTIESVRDSRYVQLAGGAFSILLLLLVVVRLRRALNEVELSEERTRENEENLATTLESIGDGVIATDSEGRITRMNPVARSITGWTLEEARGKPIQDVFHLVHDTSSKELSNPVEEALRKGNVVEIDDAAILVAKDGTRRRVADSAAPIRGGDGTTRGAVLVFRDITKTLETARMLRRTSAFLDLVVDNIPDMIFVKDAEDLAFVRFNRAGETLLGLSRDKLIGKTDFAFFPPDQAKAFIEKDRQTLRGKSVVEIAEEPVTTARGVRWLSTKKVPILDEKGEPEYLLGISADITERRRAELRLRASRDATEVAHRELESFSYSVAHDLRAPLRSIDGFSQALLDDYGDRLDEQGKSYLSRVRNAARRMAELIDDLLALARVSRSELSRSTIDLSAVAREVGEQVRKDRNPNAQLVVADGLTANADPRLVRGLLENLLGNAFKFSSRREDARVEVGREKNDGIDAFFVRDNGAGFDLAAASKLFTAFQRYHRPTEFEGTGIGLATSERIVIRHGGRIWAESAPGDGATFYFILEPREDTP